MGLQGAIQVTVCEHTRTRDSPVGSGQDFTGIAKHFERNVRVDEFIGEDVVIDVESQYVFLGRLEEIRPGWLTLRQADVHDLRDSKTTRELYVLDSRTDGIRVNRKKVVIPSDQVVSVSLLEDVIE